MTWLAGARRALRSRPAPVVAAVSLWMLDIALMRHAHPEQGNGGVWSPADIVRAEAVQAAVVGVVVVVAASSLPVVIAWCVASLEVGLLSSDFVWPAYLYTPLPNLGWMLGGLWLVGVPLVALTFPQGGLTSGGRRWVVGNAVVLAMSGVVVMLSQDPVTTLGPQGVGGWWTVPALYPLHDRVLEPVDSAVTLVCLIGTAVLAVRRWRAARGASRRGLAAVALGCCGIAVLVVPNLLMFAAPWWGWDASGYPWYQAALAVGYAWYLSPALPALPVLVEVVGRRRAAALVAEELVGTAASRGPGDALDDVVRRCLGDPTARVVVRDGVPSVERDPGAGWLGDTTIAPAVQDALSVGLRHRELLGRRRESVARLAQSRAQVVEAALEERRVVERDLHDGAQQALLGVSAVLGRADLVADDDLPDLVAQALARLAGVDAEIARLVDGLRPAELALGGLPGALPALAAGTGLEVRLTLPDAADPVPARVEAAAYFVAAEALANAVRHAAARTVELSLATTGGHVDLRVRDDGRGGAQLVPGGGLAGLAARVERLGGRLEVAPAAGGGTVVAARIPADGGVG